MRLEESALLDGCTMDAAPEDCGDGVLRKRKEACSEWVLRSVYTTRVEIALAMA